MKSYLRQNTRPWPLGWSGHIIKRIYDVKMPELCDILFHPVEKTRWLRLQNRKGKRKVLK